MKFNRTIIKNGKTIQKISPNFNGSIVIAVFWVAASESNPATSGPDEQPKSPNIASIANIAVPPFGNSFAARLKIPGHIVEAESPHSPQPIRERIGTGARVVMR